MSPAAQSRRVDIGPVIRDFAGNDAVLLRTIHSAADHIATSSIDGARYSFTMTADQYRALREFLEFAAPEFEPALCREVTKPDQVEPAFLGGERLVASGEMV